MTAAANLPPAEHGPLAEVGGALIVLALLVLLLAIGKQLLTRIFAGPTAKDVRRG